MEDAVSMVVLPNNPEGEVPNLKMASHD